MQKLREVINKNLPKGFSEGMGYGMLGWAVPHSVYPAGYHCNPKLPLPFLSIASQKNFIALHHMGMYADKDINDWFVAEYPNHVKQSRIWARAACALKSLKLFPMNL